jgi:hypothetical protein
MVGRGSLPWDDRFPPMQQIQLLGSLNGLPASPLKRAAASGGEGASGLPAIRPPFDPHKAAPILLPFPVSQGSSEARSPPHGHLISFSHKLHDTLPFPSGVQRWNPCSHYTPKKHLHVPAFSLAWVLLGPLIRSALTALQVPWPWLPSPSLPYAEVCYISFPLRESKQGLPPPFVSNCFLVAAPGPFLIVCVPVSCTGLLHVMLICQVT